MDILKLVKSFTIDNSSEKQIDALTKVIAQMMTHLGTIEPKSKEPFIALAKQLETGINEIRNENFDLFSIFSGDGHIAKRLKEHIAIFEFASIDDNTYGTKLKHDQLTKAIDMFDFKPIIDPEINKEFNSFLTSILPIMIQSKFKTSKPPLSTNGVPSEYNSLGTIITGVYGAGPDTIVALKSRIDYPSPTETEKYIEAVFIIFINGVTSMQYYHPFEKIWIKSNYTVMLPGVKEALEEQLKIALQEAGQMNKMSEDFNFAHEMMTLEELSSVVFDHEENLPRLAIVVGGTIIKGQYSGPACDGQYINQGESSIIKIDFGQNNELVFMNTKGKYPSRETTLTTKLHNFSTRLDYTELAQTSQLFIVQKANQVLEALWKEIENKK